MKGRRKRGTCRNPSSLITADWNGITQCAGSNLDGQGGGAAPGLGRRGLKRGGAGIGGGERGDIEVEAERGRRKRR